MIEAQVSIRNVCEEDLALGQLAELTWAFAGEFQGLKDQHRTLTEIELNVAISRLKSELTTFNSQFLIAELTGGQAVGYVMFRQEGTMARLEEIYVKPDFRENRVAGQLVLQSQQLVRLKGARTLEAQVHPRSLVHQWALRSGWKEASWGEEGDSQELTRIYRQLA